MTRRPPQPHLACGGVFQPDPDVPPDHLGRGACRCGLVGQPGDAHHTVPAPERDLQQVRAGDAG